MNHLTQIKITVLHLDDDELVLSELAKILKYHGIEVVSFNAPQKASEYLKLTSVSLAIVDLFLDGDDGLELSSKFIHDVLIPSKIKYFRLTSAPKLVPLIFRGVGVFDKRAVFRQSDELISEIFKTVED